MERRQTVRFWHRSTVGRTAPTGAQAAIITMGTNCQILTTSWRDRLLLETSAWVRREKRGRCCNRLGPARTEKRRRTHGEGRKKSPDHDVIRSSLRALSRAHQAYSRRLRCAWNILSQTKIRANFSTPPWLPYWPRNLISYPRYSRDPLDSSNNIMILI